MKTQILIFSIILFLVGASCFLVGYSLSTKHTIDRHKEIINKHKGEIEGYDRCDLHYITFNEKI